MDSVVGLVASIHFDRLSRCLEDLRGQVKFPVYCYCQGMSQAQRNYLVDNFNDLGIKFKFVEKEGVDLNMVILKNILISLAPPSEFYFFFDDDFRFHEGAAEKIVRTADTIRSYSTVGAISFNRANGPPLNHNSTLAFRQLCDENLVGYYWFDPQNSFSELWMNGGIMVRAEAFDGFNDVTYLFGDDIGIFLSVFFCGYDVLACDLGVVHHAGELDNSYVRLLEANYWSDDMAAHVERNNKLYGDDTPEGRAHLIYQFLERRNYLQKFIDDGLIRIDPTKRRRTMLTERGVNLHLNSRFARLK